LKIHVQEKGLVLKAEKLERRYKISGCLPHWSLVLHRWSMDCSVCCSLCTHDLKHWKQLYK